MAVRTGGPGAAGLSMIVCPLLNYPGVTMRRLKVAGQISAGTTYIELDDVKVPVTNLIGQEGMGMRYVMTNFNHERLTIAVGVTRQARVALSSAFAYTMKREAFGKTLMDQPVVRHRLAKAGAELETMWAWVEQFLYQMCHLKKEDADVKLGGLTALAKAKAGMVLNECAQTAVLLFGGNGFTRTYVLPSEICDVLAPALLFLPLTLSPPFRFSPLLSVPIRLQHTFFLSVSPSLISSLANTRNDIAAKAKSPNASTAKCPAHASREGPRT